MDTTTKEQTMSATSEWYDWRNSLMTEWSNGLGAMVAFEQTAKRSAKEKRCAECGAHGTILQPATPYNYVPYWLCEECDAHFAGSVGGETYTVLARLTKGGAMAVDINQWIKIAKTDEIKVTSLCNRRNAEKIARTYDGEARVRVNG